MKKIIEYILDNFYFISVVILSTLIWLNSYGVIKLEPHYHLIVWLGVPFFVILWKIDQSEKRMAKEFGLVIDALIEATKRK